MDERTPTKRRPRLQVSRSTTVTRSPRDQRAEANRNVPEFKVPNRAEIRAYLQTEKVRGDGSPFTRPSIADRRALRRRRNRAARRARRIEMSTNA